MQFEIQPLTWGFFLVLVPLLIHLINMMRHRRVHWAAMDFLLQAYKKHRKWIWLKQLILLLMRMGAVAVVVAMLAQWVTRGRWFDLLGGTPTHHYVLLDDSFSMSDRLGASSAFDRALDEIQRIGTVAAGEDNPQFFTLIRFSRAARETTSATVGDAGADYDLIADFNAEIVDATFPETLENKRNTIDVSDLAVGPLPAMTLLNDLIRLAPKENRIVTILSDYRTGQWENPAEIQSRLQTLEQSPASIQLVSCVRERHPNLALVDLAPSNETRAAGVPVFVEAQVKNFGPEVARNVQVNFRSAFFDPEREKGAAPNRLLGKTDNLLSVLIEEIEPGQSVSRRVPVVFPAAGKHVVQALLPSDPVTADNVSWSVMDFPDGEPVLIVDGSVDQLSAYYLESAFQPGGRAKTGIQPEIKSVADIRDSTPELLAKYRAIYLLDVPRLDDRAIENLEAYVRAGGGLGIFVGPEMDLAFYNTRLYRDGEGLFPLPLAGLDFLPADSEENVPDIEVNDHPVFAVFLGERNPFIRLITVDQYMRNQEDWEPPSDSGVQVAARLRNGAPLAIDKSFGDGRVMAWLTTIAPGWNNWYYDPSFVVVALKLQSYLASSKRAVESRQVGAPITLTLEANSYRQDLIFTTPGEIPDEMTGDRSVIEVVTSKPDPGASFMTATIGGGLEGQTDRRGIYEAWPVTAGGDVDVRRFALNVAADEGDLSLVDSKTLLTRLEPVRVEFRYADQEAEGLTGSSRDNPGLFLIVLLVTLLVLEQAMAYASSYHPVRTS